MHIQARRVAREVFTLLVIILLAVAAVPATAEEPLRWKLEEGQKFNYNMTQDMSITPPAGPAGPQKMEMRQEMDMTWDVQSVNEQREAIIRQKFNRLKVRMTLPPPLGAIEYDSTGEAAPVGLAALIEPLYKAMTKGEFVLTMTERGEIKDVQVPDEVVAALKNSPGGAAMGEMATPEGFKKMISQSALVLPENPPKPNDQWSTTVEMTNPAGGKQIVENAYRYEGLKEIEGISYAVFRPTLTLKFDGAGDQPKITQQESSGEILFDPVAGRLHSSILTQKMTIEQGPAGQTAFEQTIEATVTPAADTAPSEAANQPTKEE